MRIPVFLTTLCALLGLGLVLGAYWLLTASDPNLIRDVSFSRAQISPNADGLEDATAIRYRLNADARVSIYFAGPDGQEYYFRRNQLRSRSLEGPYEVLFSGVVEGYRRPDDTFTGEIVARLLPDGAYTWHVSAVAEAGGRRQEWTGPLTIVDGDPVLPELRAFSVSPPVITPNRDGLSDRAAVNYSLNKDLELFAGGSILVYMLGPDATRYDLIEKESLQEPGGPGQHTYDYAAGVDDFAEPPPDGTYLIYATASDAEGQRVTVTATLTLAQGGVPRADLVAPAVGDQLEVSAESVRIGDTLYFTATVNNFGAADIRTTGPGPGTCYDLDQNYNTFDFIEEPGAWRFGIDFETSPRNYPFRWAVGNPADLVERVVDGQTYYFLPKGRRAQVTGCVRITAAPLRNPLYFWAGLIHEDVEIAQFNNRIDPHLITIGVP